MNKNRNLILWIVFAILLLVTLIGVVRLFTPEDDWICEHGTWVRHGMPMMSTPTGGCREWYGQ